MGRACPRGTPLVPSPLAPASPPAVALGLSKKHSKNKKTKGQKDKRSKNQTIKQSQESFRR